MKRRRRCSAFGADPNHLMRSRINSESRKLGESIRSAGLPVTLSLLNALQNLQWNQTGVSAIYSDGRKHPKSYEGE